MDDPVVERHCAHHQPDRPSRPCGAPAAPLASRRAGRSHLALTSLSCSPTASRSTGTVGGAKYRPVPADAAAVGPNALASELDLRIRAAARAALSSRRSGALGRAARRERVEAAVGDSRDVGPGCRASPLRSHARGSLRLRVARRSPSVPGRRCSFARCRCRESFRYLLRAKRGRPGAGAGHHAGECWANGLTPTRVDPGPSAGARINERELSSRQSRHDQPGSGGRSRDGRGATRCRDREPCPSRR